MRVLGRFGNNREWRGEIVSPCCPNKIFRFNGNIRYQCNLRTHIFTDTFEIYLRLR